MPVCVCVHCILGGILFQKVSLFLNIHFLFYLQVLWILLPLGGLHTCQRLSEVHTVSEPCRLSPSWQPRESFCQTSWALTSSEFHRSSAWNLLCQTSMLIYSGSCRGLPSPAGASSWVLGCRNKLRQEGERVLKEPCEFLRLACLSYKPTISQNTSLFCSIVKQM